MGQLRREYFSIRGETQAMIRKQFGSSFTKTALRFFAIGVVMLAGGVFEPAFAGVGQPSPAQLGFQEPVTEIMHFINNFHYGMVILITAITVFVLALMLYAMYRFSEKRNPKPSQTTHHVGLEIAWTIIPVLILVVVAIPSFRLLKLDMTLPKADITIKATGHAWYWSYEYPKDQGGGFGFESNMYTGTPSADKPRLLAVDNEVVLPVNKVVRVQVTGADVIHNFAMPSFGLKMDAIPGRLNETWFKAEREGIYYGQCSRLCGQNHAFMPIAIRIVSDAKYAEWLAEAKKKFASGKAPVFAQVEAKATSSLVLSK
jgi:cytochrome c oxidase subunit II